MSVTVKFAAAADSMQDTPTQEGALLEESEPQPQKNVMLVASKRALMILFFIITSYHDPIPNKPEHKIAMSDIFSGINFEKRNLWKGEM